MTHEKPNTASDSVGTVTSPTVPFDPVGEYLIPSSLLSDICPCYTLSDFTYPSLLLLKSNFFVGYTSSPTSSLDTQVPQASNAQDYKMWTTQTYDGFLFVI